MKGLTRSWEQCRARLGGGLQLKVLGMGQEVSDELVISAWLEVEVEVVGFVTEVGG